MTMLPYLRCISETEKINKLNNMYIMKKGLPRAMSKFGYSKFFRVFTF